MHVLETDIKEVDKIFHIADIHIRPYKRHEEYKEVFSKLYESIKNQSTPNSIIVLAGDIVHAKTEMTPELIVMVYELLLQLSAICPLIIIPGNHDANLNNVSRLDAISPVINSSDLNNIYYIKKSGLYNFANLTFSHMSIFDNPSEYIAAETFEATFKIALFHGIVDNATNDFGYKLKSDKINKKTFEGFDLVLLGDIHSKQFLSNNIAYPGSLIQQNHGESLEKGYLIWSLPDKSSEFVKIDNQYGYYTLEIKDKKIPEIKDIPNKCRLRLQIYDANNEDVNKIIAQIRQKYKPTELTTNRINSTFIGSKSQVIEIHNLHSVQYQNELIEKYLTENYDLDRDVIDIICKINAETNKEIIIDDAIKNVRWKPVSFKWSNMFSYGENNIVNFTNLKGIVGLFGPNATGKSAFVDSLSFCLFDKASKDFSPANIMNNRTNFLDCELQFNILDKQYFINRNLKKDKKGDAIYKVNFWTFDENGKKQSLNGENRWGTNKNINNIVGTFEDFILTTFSMQEKNANYINVGHAKRKDLIIQFMGLGIFDSLHEIAKEQLKDIKAIIKDLQKEDWDTDIEQHISSLKTEKLQYDDSLKQIVELTKEQENKQDKLNKLQKKIVDIDVEIDIEAVKENYEKLIKTKMNEKDYVDNELINKVNKIQLEVSEKREQTMNYFNMNVESLYSDYKKLSESKKTLVNNFEKLNIVLKGKYDKIKKLKEVKYDVNCTFCMNNALVKDAIKTKDEIEIDEKQLLDLSNQIDTLEEIIQSKSHIENDYKTYKDVSVELADLQRESNDLNNELEKKNSYIASLEQQAIEANDDIKKYEENKIAIENNRKLEKEILQLDTDIALIASNLKIIDRKKLSIYGKIQVIESNIQSCQQSKEKLEKNIIMSEYYEHYLECIKRDGIPYKIITNIIPALEIEINNILNQIVDFTISVVPDDKNINMFIVYDQNRIWPLELASGMEKFISSIALRVALTNISNLPRPNFLIIDEGWGTLDSDNLNSVSMLLDYLKTQFDFIIIISHIASIKEVADINMEITRKDNFSQISYDK